MTNFFFLNLIDKLNPYARNVNFEFIFTDVIVCQWVFAPSFCRLWSQRFKSLNKSPVTKILLFLLVLEKRKSDVLKPLKQVSEFQNLFGSFRSFFVSASGYKTWLNYLYNNHFNRIYSRFRVTTKSQTFGHGFMTHRGTSSPLRILNWT